MSESLVINLIGLIAMVVFCCVWAGTQMVNEAAEIDQLQDTAAKEPT